MNFEQFPFNNKGQSESESDLELPSPPTPLPSPTPSREEGPQDVEQVGEASIEQVLDEASTDVAQRAMLALLEKVGSLQKGLPIPINDIETCLKRLIILFCWFVFSKWGHDL